VIGNLNLLFGLVLGEAQKLRALDFEETSILYNTAFQRFTLPDKSNLQARTSG